jgi:hypothetical protein
MNGVTIRPQRAPRFNLRKTLRYRVPGQPGWHIGKTKNISQSGVLFEGERSLGPNTPVKMSFLVRDRSSGQAVGVILCAGHIVRTAESLGGPAALAVKICHYQRLPRESTPNQVTLSSLPAALGA